MQKGIIMGDSCKKRKYVGASNHNIQKEGIDFCDFVYMRRVVALAFYPKKYYNNRTIGMIVSIRLCTIWIAIRSDTSGDTVQMHRLEVIKNSMLRKVSL